jgi:hypothetical protein
MRLKGIDKSLIEDLDKNIKEFEKIEKDYWFDFFEKTYIAVMNSEERDTIKRESREAFTSLYKQVVPYLQKVSQY